MALLLHRSRSKAIKENHQKMILGSLRHSDRYEQLHPLFKKLFDYVKTHDFLELPAGRIEIEGDDLFIIVSDVTLKTAAAQKLEVHQKYLDIHIPLTGTEIIGWRSLDSLTAPDAPFHEEEDYAVYTAPASTYIKVHPKEFLIVYPEDAHAPIIGEGSLRKLVIKVKCQ